MSLLRFDAVSKSYPGGHAALTDVGFSVEAGEMLFITGHSGAGSDGHHGEHLLIEHSASSVGLVTSPTSTVARDDRAGSDRASDRGKGYLIARRGRALKPMA